MAYLSQILSEAKLHKNWKNAMVNGYDALIRALTLTLVKKEPKMNIIRFKCVF